MSALGRGRAQKHARHTNTHTRVQVTPRCQSHVHMHTHFCHPVELARQTRIALNAMEHSILDGRVRRLLCTVNADGVRVEHSHVSCSWFVMSHSPPPVARMLKPATAHASARTAHATLSGTCMCVHGHIRSHPRCGIRCCGLTCLFKLQVGSGVTLCWWSA